MKHEKFSITVRFGGRTKQLREDAKKITHSKDLLYGLSSYSLGKKSPYHCDIWVYSRQNLKEITDTFFHEITHVFLRMVAGIKNQKRREEVACSWMGYLAKKILSDYKGLT